MSVLLVTALAAMVVSACTSSATAAREHMQRGDGFTAKKDYANATIEYRLAVQSAPRSVEAHMKLGQSYLEDQSLGSAVGEFVRAADLRTSDLALQLAAARLLELTGAFTDATTRLRYVLNQDPNNVDAQILLGKAMLGLKDPDGALLQLEGAVKRLPNESRTYAALGAMELEKGQRQAAEAAFRKATEINPKSPQAHLAMGYFNWSTHHLPEAEQSFLTALQLDPTNVFAHRLLTTLYLATNRPAEAEKHLKALADASDQPEPRLDFADFYLDRNRLQEARDILAGLASDPRVATKAKQRLALIAFQQGRRTEAVKMVDDVLQQSPNNIAALNTKIRMLLADQRVDEALVTAKRAVAADPSSATAHYLLATIYATQNNTDAALKGFNQVLKLDPAAVPARLHAAHLYLAVGDASSALNAANEAVSVEPLNPDALLIRARAYLAKGDVKLAESDLSDLARKYPGSPTVQTQLGLVSERKADVAGARGFYQRALALDPENREALDGVVRLDINGKRPAEARRRVEARLAKSPNDPVLLVLLATTYTAEGDAARAEATLKKVLTIDPASLAAHTRLGRLYVAAGRLEEARLEYEKAGAGVPPSIPALTTAGQIFEAQHKTEEAKRQYERILQIDPKAAVAANNLASIYLERGENLDLAIGLAQTAKREMPNDAAVSDTLGWLFYSRDMASMAISPLRESIAQDPTNALYHYHLGMAYLRTKDLKAAKESLERALQLSPGFRGADEARKALASLR